MIGYNSKVRAGIKVMRSFSLPILELTPEHLMILTFFADAQGAAC